MFAFEDPRQTLYDAGLTRIDLNGSLFRLEPRPVGRGGSCLVYYARKQEAPGLERRVILKEFYPLLQFQSPCREENGCIPIDLQDPETRFRLDRFRKSRELSVLLHNTDSMNPHVAEVQERIEANGTEYMVVGYSSGVTLQEYLSAGTRPSLHELLTLIRRLALVVERLHALEYLHMDLKPDNILCLPSGEIQIIDTDSILPRDSLKDGKAALSYSQGFAPPEILDCARDPGKLKDIAQAPEQVDIYSLGAILYYSLFGSTPQPVSLHRTRQERMADAAGLQAVLRDWLPEISGDTVARFSKLLNKALARWPKSRWHSTGEFLLALDALLPLVQPDRIRILEDFSPNKYPVEGRRDKLELLQRFFESQPAGHSRIVCISGLGGIGKSTLARQYAADHREEYDVITEVSASSAEDAIRNIRILHWSADPDLPTDLQTRQRVDMLGTLCRKQKTLLIVHNYDVSGDLSDWIWKQLDCDIILTSRYYWNTLEVPVVSLQCSDLKTEDALRIFDCFYFGAIKPGHYPPLWKDASQQEALHQLVLRLNCHPLGIKLIALYMASVPDLLPLAMLDTLTETVFRQDSPVTFTTRSSHGLLDENIHGHLQIIFQTALRSGNLTEAELDALRNMLLSNPDHGISAGRFSRWTGMETNYLALLQRKGWLDFDPQRTDPLDPQPHSGIYLMPLLLQQVLSDNPDMSPGHPGCRHFLSAAAGAITGHYQTADRRQCLCREQERLLGLLRDIRTEDVARLCNTTGANLYNLNPMDSPQDRILEYSELCITILTDLGLEDHPLIPDSYHNMGIIYQQQDRLQDAYDCLCYALDLEKKYNKANIGQTAQTELAIAGLHWEVGRMDQAIRMAETAYRSLEGHREQYCRDFVFACSCLGRYWQDTGHLEQAETCLRQALKLCDAHIEDAADSTKDLCLGILLQLGSVYLDRNRTDEAIACLQRSLDQSNSLYGEDAFSPALEAHLSLADAYTRKGSKDLAIEHREAFLRIYRDNRDPDSWSDAEALIYAAFTDSQFDIDRFRSATPQQEPDLQDWFPADCMLHLALDYVHRDTNTVSTYILAANCALRLCLGKKVDHLSGMEEFESAYGLYYKLAECHFRKGKIPMGLKVLESSARLSARFSGMSRETGSEYKCLSQAYKAFKVPKKAAQYRTMADICGTWTLTDRLRSAAPGRDTDLHRVLQRGHIHSQTVRFRELMRCIDTVLKYRRKKDRG